MFFTQTCRSVPRCEAQLTHTREINRTARLLRFRMKIEEVKCRLKKKWERCGDGVRREAWMAGCRGANEKLTSFQSFDGTFFNNLNIIHVLTHVKNATVFTLTKKPFTSDEEKVFQLKMTQCDATFTQPSVEMVITCVGFLGLEMCRIEENKTRQDPSCLPKSLSHFNPTHDESFFATCWLIAFSNFRFLRHQLTMTLNETASSFSAELSLVNFNYRTLCLKQKRLT